MGGWSLSIHYQEAIDHGSLLALAQTVSHSPPWEIVLMEGVWTRAVRRPYPGDGYV